MSYRADDNCFAIVSPKDRTRFVDAIRQRQPKVIVDVDSDIARDGSLLWAVAASFFPVVLIVGGTSFAGGNPPEIIVNSSALAVNGTFGTHVRMGDITDVTMPESMPRVLHKHMGYDGISSLQGRFELEGIGDGFVYVKRSAHPFVLIRTSDSFVYINYPESARTRELFDQVKRARASASDSGTSTTLR